MSDSISTLLAYLLSLSLMLGYSIRIAMARRKEKLAHSDNVPSSTVLIVSPPKEAVVCEVKPASKIRVS